MEGTEASGVGNELEKSQRSGLCVAEFVKWGGNKGNKRAIRELGGHKHPRKAFSFQGNFPLKSTEPHTHLEMLIYH